jgi:molybdenum cofactor biosynthesis enzyme MoaA
MALGQPAPFCSQPWSTIYVQWDGTLVRPCIRGPQTLGSIFDGADAAAFWAGATFRQARQEIATREGLKPPCASCHADRGRLIDHMNPFWDNLDEFSAPKIRNYYAALAAHRTAETEIAHGPLVVILDIGAKCNVRCPKCFVYNSDMQFNVGNMTMETFERVRPLLATALLVVGHENGESILNRNFFEMARIIKENGCRFTFNTTGQTVTRDKAQRLVDLGVDQMMFSIDSIETERYAHLHKGGTLARLMANLTGLAEIKAQAGTSKPELGWYFTGSKSNMHELPAMVERAHDLGFRSMYVSTLNRPSTEQWQSYRDYYAAENLVTEDDSRRDAVRMVTEAEARARSYGMQFFKGSFY